MLIYSTHITARLRYILDFFQKEIFELPLELTEDRAVFAHHPGPRLNYSAQEISGEEFYLEPVALLFESDIRDQRIECFELNFQKAFFQTKGDFPFDILAASFYLLSRYEEYLPSPPDSFGRFDHRQSLAHREHFLQQPLVNQWMQEFRKALQAKFPDLPLRPRTFTFIPTYDIDMAYSYLHKGWIRNLGGLLRSMVRGEWGKFRERIQVLSGRRTDPYDCYEWLDSLHLYCRVKPRYFFLLADRAKDYDKNISPRNPAFRSLITYHCQGYPVGIHPSWQSGDKPELLERELRHLEALAGRKVDASRQHFIRLRLPDTYRRLLDLGIEKDFSMGYGSINGFRASVASSFYWYDLAKESATKLLIYPFCFMDANAYYEQGLPPLQAMEELMGYYRQIRRLGGLMVTLWHNSFLGSDPLFAGWREVYEVFLKEEVFWDS